MLYENELRFLCNTLKKRRIKTSFAVKKSIFNNMFDEAFIILFGENLKNHFSVDEFADNIKPYTMYKFSALRLCYVFFLLPAVSSEQIMIIGPYLSEEVETKYILEAGEKYGISPSKQKLLQDYYANIPTVSDNDSIFTMLETFGEHIWGGSSGFTIIDINREMVEDNTVLSKDRSNEDVESLMVNMELMKKRYDYENELIRAVSLGQVHKVAQLTEKFSDFAFERRITDPVRNLKNYAIIMNTLLRKAAEKGGVHPLYIHDVSSDFAVRIEQLSSVAAVSELMAYMFKSYCRLVRKHSMKNYSSAVQKVITLINSDLSANLTLQSLAKSQNISAGYLSSVFKKETGKTLTEYIIGERMQLAMRLLSTTRLQIQTIALHCGIMDVQYFSKLFKRHTGKTPKEYRSTGL